MGYEGLLGYWLDEFERISEESNNEGFQKFLDKVNKDLILVCQREIENYEYKLLGLKRKIIDFSKKIKIRSLSKFFENIDVNLEPSPEGYRKILLILIDDFVRSYLGIKNNYDRIIKFFEDRIEGLIEEYEL